ncbi:hypothetical protein RA210_U290007 [Rubrivivax sp. A210]|nr:hypothetical protein RA210_U290007 [Rubrivivax sp. A210]
MCLPLRAVDLAGHRVQAADVVMVHGDSGRGGPMNQLNSMATYAVLRGELARWCQATEDHSVSTEMVYGPIVLNTDWRELHRVPAGPTTLSRLCRFGAVQQTPTGADSVGAPLRLHCAA